VDETDLVRCIGSDGSRIVGSGQAPPSRLGDDALGSCLSNSWATVDPRVKSESPIEVNTLRTHSQLVGGLRVGSN